MNHFAYGSIYVSAEPSDFYNNKYHFANFDHLIYSKLWR